MSYGCIHYSSIYSNDTSDTFVSPGHLSIDLTSHSSETSNHEGLGITVANELRYRSNDTPMSRIHRLECNRWSFRGLWRRPFRRFHSDRDGHAGFVDNTLGRADARNGFWELGDAARGPPWGGSWCDDSILPVGRAERASKYYDQSNSAQRGSTSTPHRRHVHKDLLITLFRLDTLHTLLVSYLVPCNSHHIWWYSCLFLPDREDRLDTSNWNWWRHRAWESILDSCSISGLVFRRLAKSYE